MEDRSRVIGQKEKAQASRVCARFVIMLLTAYSVERILRRVPWTVEVTTQFEQWWDSLTEDERVSIDGMIRVLESRGPTIGPPYSVQTVGSRYPQMRELRVPHQGEEICVIYATDEPRPTLVLLTGTRISSSPETEPCPPELVTLAESIYGSYLAARRER